MRVEWQSHRVLMCPPRRRCSIRCRVNSDFKRLRRSCIASSSAMVSRSADSFVDTVVLSSSSLYLERTAVASKAVQTALLRSEWRALVRACEGDDDTRLVTAGITRRRNDEKMGIFPEKAELTEVSRSADDEYSRALRASVDEVVSAEVTRLGYEHS